LVVAPLSFEGRTASHQMLLAPNTETLTVDDVARACSTLATAHPKKSATKTQSERILVVYMMM
jgi:hypothetical protein